MKRITKIFGACCIAAAVLSVQVGCGSSASGVVSGEESADVAAQQKALLESGDSDERNPGN